MMRIMQYLNQFFGGIGGEDQAEYPLTVTAGALGPGRLLAEKNRSHPGSCKSASKEISG